MEWKGWEGNGRGKMKISELRRKVISKIFVNFSGIIFGLLVIGPFAAEKGINLIKIIIGLLLLAMMIILSVISAPGKLIKEGE